MFLKDLFFPLYGLIPEYVQSSDPDSRPDIFRPLINTRLYRQIYYQKADKSICNSSVNATCIDRSWELNKQTGVRARC